MADARWTETKLTEMTLKEEKVLEKLNLVSTAKRLANMVSLRDQLSIRMYND